MSSPQLPESYGDDEVRIFHPVFEYAADQAIAALGLADELELAHHYPIGDIIPDFVFLSRTSGKIHLIVEIKRTRGQVQTTGYRNQARNYYVDAGARMATPYFAVSNLEHTDLFRNRAGFSLAGQLLKDCPFDAGTFFEERDGFIDRLTHQLVRILELIDADTKNGETPEYAIGLGELESALKTAASQLDHWHPLLMPASYQYIMGASVNSPALGAKVSEGNWQPATAEMGRPQRLATKGAAIDFGAVFSPPYPAANHEVAFDIEILEQARQSGAARGSADDLATVVAGIVRSAATNTQGVVETDPELSRLLQRTAASCREVPLAESDVICDPAAGAGQLLVGATEAFAGLTPSQLWANDIDPRFAEVTALRLGLDHSEKVGPGNQPKITSNDISLLDRAEFDDVRVVLMNPPFVRGVDATELRATLAAAVERATGTPSLLDFGQTGLESVFLELVTALVPNGTVVATVFPHRTLLGTGPEAIALRQFLLGSFGLRTLVEHSRIGIFESVTKKTAIIAGVKGSDSDIVRRIRLSPPLANVDFSAIGSALDHGNAPLHHGISVHNVARRSLSDEAASGWGYMLGGRAAAIEWFGSLGISLVTIDAADGLQLRRGPAGNSGGSDLIFPREDSSWKSAIPAEWLVVGVRNANEEEVPAVVNKGTSSARAISVPDEAFDPDAAEFKSLESVVQAFLADTAPNHSERAQAKAEMTAEKAKNALRSTRNPIRPGSIILPRAIRRFGRITVVEEPAVLSTNFFALSTSESWPPEAVAAWLASIFGQLQFEIHSVDQEGMRKSERGHLSRILLPEMNNLSWSPEDLVEIREAFETSPPLDFYEPIQPRPVDLIWTRYVRQIDSETIAACVEQLENLIDDRHPA